MDRPKLGPLSSRRSRTRCLRTSLFTLLTFLGTFTLLSKFTGTPLTPTWLTRTFTSTRRGGSADDGAPVDEIYGLLHFVLAKGSNDEPTSLGHVTDLDPTREVPMGVYAAAAGAGAGAGGKVPWGRVKAGLDQDAPLVVFSKTYCPFCRRTKALLERYDLSPAPKIVEVDLRDDGDIIKQLLMRLTQRGTFPNTILKGKTIGGSDDLHAMHESGELRKVFEGAGVVVRGAV